MTNKCSLSNVEVRIERIIGNVAPATQSRTDQRMNAEMNLPELPRSDIIRRV
jgi:hypothetical protein